jgi:arylsulfatase A-like enzyme
MAIALTKRASPLMLRRLLGVGMLLLVEVGLSCNPGPLYETKRPWLEDPAIELELVSSGHVTRPAVRLQARPGAPTLLPLGEVEPGWIETAASLIAAPGARVELRVIHSGDDDAGPRCLLHLAGTERAGATWQDCRIPIKKPLREAHLQVHLATAEPVELALASPVLATGQPSRRPPVFVFLVDTVRADSVEALQDTMELGAFDGLAAEGLVFTQMRSTSSWTTPAVASLLTGSFPAMRHQGGALGVDLEQRTLPELLQERGYRTLAWSSNPNVLPNRGFAQGFDVFVDVGATEWVRQEFEVKADAAVVFNSVMKALEGEPMGGAFYYVHLMDAHAPYLPRSRHLKQAGELRRSPGPEPGDLYQSYLAEIIDLGEQLDRFMTFLKARGVYEDAVILVVSDHGEEFLEHGGLQHGRTLYEEVLRVPAVLKLPDGRHAGVRIEQPSNLTDLMPTMLAALGIEQPEGLDGRSFLKGGSLVEVPPRRETPVLRADDYRMTAMLQFPWKLIVNHREEEELLFHLADDPHEQINLIGDQGEIAVRLRGELDVALVPHEQGWHVRACGGSGPGSIRFELFGGHQEARPFMFEEEDFLSGRERSIKVEMDLGVREEPRLRAGRFQLEQILDEDEVVLPVVVEGDSIVELRSQVELVYALGTRPGLERRFRVHLDSRDERVLVRPSESVECETPPMGGAGPHLRVWFVPPVPRAREAPDPVLQQRLRALGYLGGEPAE